MIIGFVGKGGSGKSTLSTHMTRFLANQNNIVLAIDADHNMDLTYNLGAPDNIPYLGQALPELKNILGQPDVYHYRDLFTDTICEKFSLNPADNFTKTWSVQLTHNLLLMTTGPHTEDILFGQKCSHSLGTALKVYLPLLSLGENDYVVIDEKAGRDGVGTGVVTGWDFAVVVAEPTPHSLKAATQITELLDFFGTPYEFVINKAVSSEKQLYQELPKQPLVTIPYNNHSGNSPIDTTALQTIIDTARASTKQDRLIRSKKKFYDMKVYETNRT